MKIKPVLTRFGVASWATIHRYHFRYVNYFKQFTAALRKIKKNFLFFFFFYLFKILIITTASLETNSTLIDT